MDVCKYDLASLQHSSTDHYENWHVYVFFCGEGFCAILFVTASHQVVLQHINFCNPQVDNMAAKNDASMALSPTLFRYVSVESSL
ncbi:hypothetical protein TNCV_4977441 [Trichonephila clavipes]|nr:hypothetical protein TNCV_4977441 [Trichonephila clavipes]